MNVRLLTSLVAVVLVLATGCPIRPVTYDFTIDDDGTAARIELDQTITIMLPSNASTGYTWRIGSVDQAVVQFVHSVYMAGAVGGIVGAPGKEVWTFNAEGLGATTLRLVYVRPADGAGQTPQDEFVLNLTVVERGDL